MYRDEVAVVCNETGTDYDLVACPMGCDSGGCIAVTCTPGELKECQGTTAVTCNAAGNGYKDVVCERGCDTALGGCHLCDPGETACTNGTLAVCGANGEIVSSTPCALRCHPTEARCLAFVPVNGLQTYADMVPNPPVLALTDAVFHTDDGTVTAASGSVSVPSFLAPASGSGVAVRVFVVNSLDVSGATFRPAVGSPMDPAGPGVAIVGRGDIVLRGLVTVTPRAGGAMTGCSTADSGITVAGTMTWTSGGGGGGNATTGAIGGSAMTAGPGGGGGSSGTAALAPLRGGCAGGIDPGTDTLIQSNGGGALQVSSSTRIEIQGTLAFEGGAGTSVADTSIGGTFRIGGGGAGGSVLLDAPIVMFTSAAAVDARGGTGGQCTPTGMSSCEAGGMGATASAAAQPGVNANAGAAGSHHHAGGGGGGLGRLRVNTGDGTYVAPSTLDAAATVGTVQSR